MTRLQKYFVFTLVLLPPSRQCEPAGSSQLGSGQRDWLIQNPIHIQSPFHRLYIFLSELYSVHLLAWVGRQKEGFVVFKMLKIPISDTLISSLSLFCRQRCYCYCCTFFPLAPSVMSVRKRKRKFSLKFLFGRCCCHSFVLWCGNQMHGRNSSVSALLAHIHLPLSFLLLFSRLCVELDMRHCPLTNNK